MTDWVTGAVETIGYAGIVALMALEIPLPVVQSEIVMTFSGFAARTGELSLVGVVVAGVVGSQIGSLVLYAACRRLPEARVRGFVADHGTWLGLTRDKLHKGEERFRRHSGVSVLVGRLLPGLRGFIAVPAGLVGMPLWPFFAYNLLGAAVWTTVLALLGFWLGSQYQLVDRYSTYLTVAFVAAVVAALVWRVVQVRRARSSR